MVAPGVLRLAWLAACGLAISSACAPAPQYPSKGDGDSDPIAALDTLLADERYDELLAAIEARKARIDAGAHDELLELRLRGVLASAGLGDCGPARRLMDDDLPGIDPHRLAAVASRAADLAVGNPVQSPLLFSWTRTRLLIEDPEISAWNRRLSDSVCVLESAARRFPPAADRIEKRIAMLRTLVVTEADIAEHTRTIRSLLHFGGCPDESFR